MGAVTADCHSQAFVGYPRHSTRQVALACHDSRSLLCVCFADGVLHLYDTTRAQQEAGASSGGDGSDVAQLREPRGPEEEQQDQDENEEVGAAEGRGDEGGADNATPSVKLTKAQRQLLLVPVAALTFGAGIQGTPSCLAFSQEPDFLLAGTTGALEA
jgi:hypothetical protein